MLESFEGRNSLQQCVSFLVQVALFSREMFEFSNAEIAAAAVILASKLIGNTSYQDLVPAFMLTPRISEAVVTLFRAASNKGLTPSTAMNPRPSES
jgi:hypothetical protein